MADFQPVTNLKSEAGRADSSSFWSNKRVIVTGGAGFLGSFVTEKLQQRRAAEIIVPKIEEYNLCEIQDIHRLYNHVLVLKVPAIQRKPPTSLSFIWPLWLVVLAPTVPDRLTFSIST
jgi:hypothetical protein